MNDTVISKKNKTCGGKNIKKKLFPLVFLFMAQQYNKNRCFKSLRYNSLCVCQFLKGTIAIPAMTRYKVELAMRKS